MNIIAWLITLAALLVVIYEISYRTGESFLGVMPGVVGGFILVLYLLAFIRGMGYIWIISIIALAGCLILNRKSSGQLAIKEQLVRFKNYYFNPQIIIVLVGLILIGIMTSGHVYTWWDDINFWATDSKALYYLNGFPGKYGNVSPEFGDYPPALQIAKWCILKLSTDYREGLAFSGYYVFSVIFLIPILKPFRNKNILFQIVGLLAVILIPGVCNTVWSQGGCADVVMGYVFGTILIDALDYDSCDKSWYYIRLGIYLSILCLTKSSGFEWAVFSGFFIMIMANRHNRNSIDNKRISLKYLWISIGCAGLFQVSWWIFCLANRRIAKLTSSGVHMVSNGYHLPENASDKLQLFWEGLVKYPMHTDRTALINISSLVMLIIFLAIILMLGILGVLKRYEFTVLSAFLVAIAVITYGIILLGHMSIFNGETQYNTADIMAISVSRYASPLTIGFLMLCISIIVSRVSKLWVYCICVAFVMVSTDIPAYLKTVYLYRNSVAEETEERYAVVDESGRQYINVVAGNKTLWGHRVLYLRDADSAHWVKDTYISYYASPVPTVYESFSVSNDGADYIKELIMKNHASYLYVEPQKEDASSLFSNFIGDDSFKYATIYSIVEDAQGIRLVQDGGSYGY